MTQFFPEQTIRYKTFAKQTLVDGLNKVLRAHPDELLNHTHASIEFPKTEVDYPCVVIRFFERSIFNAGVGHEEVVSVAGESDSIEVSATLVTDGSAQLSWPSIDSAQSYRVFRGTAPGKEDTRFVAPTNSFTDTGNQGVPAAPPTLVTAVVDTPQPTVTVGPNGSLPPGTYYYRVFAIEPTQAVKFQHYFYTADIEFAIYALSAYDRDLIADTVVQMIAMGKLEVYTSQFFDRVYASAEIFPDAQLHFININSDEIQGFGENQTETPWGAEDEMLYMTSYRVGVFGELYSLPPKLTYGFIERVFFYPYVSGIDPVPNPPNTDPNAWVSNIP